MSARLLSYASDTSYDMFTTEHQPLPSMPAFPTSGDGEMAPAYKDPGAPT